MHRQSVCDGRHNCQRSCWLFFSKGIFEKFCLLGRSTRPVFTKFLDEILYCVPRGEIHHDFSIGRLHQITGNGEPYLGDGRICCRHKVCRKQPSQKTQGCWLHSHRSSISYFSITVFASSFSHISFRFACAFVSSRSSISISMTLPCLTSPTSRKPRLFSAWPMALPCGSRTPFLRVMKTRAFMVGF